MKIDTLNRTITVPKYLFRYLRDDANLNAMLAKPYLWFSNPKNFNDPFDLTNTFTAESDIDDLIWYLKKYSPSNFNEKSEFYEKVFSSEETRNGIFKSFNDFQSAIHKTYLENIGICCFSYENASTLMWSHYASGHEGVCIVIDTKRFISDFALLKVDYVDVLPKWNWIENRKKFGNSATYNINIDQAVLGSKFKQWAYENEYRLISRKQGKHLIYPEAIAGIICGTKMNAHRKIEIENLAQKMNSQTAVFEATLNHSIGEIEVSGLSNELITLKVSGFKSIHDNNEKLKKEMLNESNSMLEKKK